METIENLQTQSQQALQLKTWNAPEIRELDTVFTNNNTGTGTDGYEPGNNANTTTS